jgi:hypothetical protein
MLADFAHRERDERHEHSGAHTSWCSGRLFNNRVYARMQLANNHTSTSQDSPFQNLPRQAYSNQLTMHLLSSLVIVGTSLSLSSAHVSAWALGMYCLGGPDPNHDDEDTRTAVAPLYHLKKQDWWFQHDRGCDKAPPKNGDILKLPAGGSFDVEFATSRGYTSLSHGGKYATDIASGKIIRTSYNNECLGPLHTKSEAEARGSAFAISYNSDIKDVTMENLVVFSVLYNSPFKRKGRFQVPSKMPACPPGGCICAWLWVPDACGTKNMYMTPFKCTVTNPHPTSRIAFPAKPPTICGGKRPQSSCVRGAKQMIAVAQLEGNNVKGSSESNIPQYNQVCGFKNGAQDDIFEDRSAPEVSESFNFTAIDEVSAVVPSHDSSASYEGSAVTLTPESSNSSSEVYF